MKTSTVAAEPAPSPFERLAPTYDRSFTRSLLGGTMRRAVAGRFDACFPPGARVLELGCGTGEDALELARRGLFVVATDGAAAMAAETRRKVACEGVADRIEVRRMSLEELAAGGLAGERFDGVLSDFGPLNCVADLGAVAAALAALVRPGGAALLCLMGPLVPWEWAWFLGRGAPRRAFRRLAPGGARWRGLAVRYPTPRRLARAFAPAFRRRRLAALGALVPPTYAEPWAARHPELVRRLDRWERRWETRWPLPWLADHYVMELERR